MGFKATAWLFKSARQGEKGSGFQLLTPFDV
jgi:hypothetical protein